MSSGRFGARRFGPVQWYDELTSTNEVLASWAREGAADGLVVAARYQTAGRGRLDRRWEAPPGRNLLISVLTRIGLAPQEFHVCTSAMALGALDLAQDLAGVRAEIKWPNDLLVGGRKLAGILTDLVDLGSLSSEHGPPRPACLVVGLGMNLGWPDRWDDIVSGPDTGVPDASDTDTDTGTDPSDAGTDEQCDRVLDIEPTSLRAETGEEFDPRFAADRLLDLVEPLMDEVGTPGGRRRVMARYRSACATLGQLVRVVTAEDTFEGLASAISDGGHLVVQADSGPVEVVAGDVVHLRTQR